MAQISEHFTSEELACHHCGKLVLDPKLVPALEALRALVNVPIFVDDAYRCPEHNAAVGGVPNSEHTLGMAADIVIQGFDLVDMYYAAQKVDDFNNGGIGAYDGKPFIHVDVRPTRARWARVKGKYVGIEALIKP